MILSSSRQGKIWFLSKDSFPIALRGCFSKESALAGLINVFSKTIRKCFSPGPCHIPRFTYEFQHKFNQIFDIVLNFLLPQFSHLLTIHTLQTLVWSQCVCWLGLHSIFPFRKKCEIKRKTYMPLLNPFLAWEEMISWIKNNWLKVNLENGEKVFVNFTLIVKSWLLQVQNHN